MDVRLLPKLLLWAMLIVSSLGAVSTVLRTETDPTPAILKKTTEQQMAVHTALSFAREWMRWDGEELPEARMHRLKPYVNPDDLVRIAALQPEQKTKRQEVIAAEFVSSSSSGGPRYAVRVRVIAANPERVVWEVDVPVLVQTGKGAAVTAPPLIRSPQEPPAVPETGSGEPEASADVKQRMRPAIESFLKAMCEGKDADSLFNYVTTGSNLKPLEGRIRFLALERLEAVGVGPYKVTVTFSVQDAATGFRVTQVCKLAVTEENQKFFVGSVE
ncbi:conjugal transfer protein [Cohnella algarum]|uniref:conjugal transfer protein n=1 Tax=Cohnella algarum TaxID=2044859 RepID=UPI0019682F24|nr:conjugal transfer protein [Cohnella algarum]MBN2981811.1 conjugal transfer protein [Cohnella algarum]